MISEDVEKAARATIPKALRGCTVRLKPNDRDGVFTLQASWWHEGRWVQAQMDFEEATVSRISFDLEGVAKSFWRSVMEKRR